MQSPDDTILWIKEQLTNDTPLRAMYQAKKSDIFIMWAEALEQKILEGTLKISITGISNEIRQELKSMNLERAVYWMHEVLPPKYKKNTPPQYLEEQDEGMTVGKPTENSSVDYSMKNQTLLQVTKNLRSSIDTLQELLETTDIETNCETKYLDEVIKMSNVVGDKAKFCTDGREKVSRLDHVLTLQLANSCTLNSIYDTLTAQKMSQATITSKQMGKIVAMKIKDAYATLRPSTEQQAIQQGWSGITCDSCGEFRVSREYHSDSHDFMDHCVSCGNWQKMKLSPVIDK